MIVLLAGTIALVACGGGGSGGGDDDPVSRTQSDLAAALAAITPCAPTTGQIRAVTVALETLQSMGATPTPTSTQAGRALAAQARAYARHVAEETTSVDDPGDPTGLGAYAGLDTSRAEWIDDPACPTQFDAHIEFASVGQVPGIISGLVIKATVPIAISDRGVVSGTARAKVAASMSMPPPCTPVVFDPAETNITLGGAVTQGTMAMTFAHSGVRLTGTSNCSPPGFVLPPAPAEVSFDPLSNGRITLPARHAGSGSAGPEDGLPPGSVLQVVLARRR